MVFGIGNAIEIIIRAKDEFSNKLRRLNSQLDSTKKNFQAQFQQIANSAKVVGAAITGIGVALGAFITGSVMAAANLNESINAVNVVFGESANVILDWGKTASHTVGLSQRQFNQAAVGFAGLVGQMTNQVEEFSTRTVGSTTMVVKSFKSVPLSADEVAKKTIELIQRAADFASVMNLDVNDAIVKFQAGLSGEIEPLKRYGIIISEANVKTFAYANGIAQVGQELTDAQKAQARYGLLMQETEKFSGDFSNTSNSLVNRLRILKASFEDNRAAIGNLTSGFEFAVGLVQKLLDWFANLSPETQKLIGIIIALVAGFALVIGPLLLIIGFLPSLVGGFTLLIPVIAGVAPVLGVVVVAVLAAIAIILVLKEVITKLRENWEVIWKSIGNFFIKIWNAIVQGFEDRINAIIKLLNFLIAGFNKASRLIGFTIPKIPEANFQAGKIPELAEGGIVTKPTLAMIGEAGPEAVIPLNRHATGITINIENIYGMNPEQVSRALRKELFNKIRL